MNIVAVASRYILTWTVILYRKLCHIQFYYEENVASSSQMFMPTYQTTWYHIPKDSNLQILLEFYIYPNDYAPKWEAANKLCCNFLCCHKSLDTVLNQYKLMLKDVFCILTPCSMVEIYNFGGLCCFHLQSRKDFESIDIISHLSTLKMEAQDSSKMLINCNVHYGITTQKPASSESPLWDLQINVLVQEVYLSMLLY